MNLKKLNLTVLLVTILVLVPTIQIVYASGLSTFYLSGGIYPHSVNYTIWKEGTTYYAKNAYGFLQFSGTNLTKVANDAINALPSISVQLPDPSTTVITTVTGWIHFHVGKFYLSNPIQIPLGARIKITGCGTTHQMIKNGINGGTQIINSGSTPAFQARAID